MRRSGSGAKGRKAALSLFVRVESALKKSRLGYGFVFLRGASRPLGDSRQAQCFWCSVCHWIRCSSVGLAGILFCWCQSLFMRSIPTAQPKS